jgi:hypothetical protein
LLAAAPVDVHGARETIQIVNAPLVELPNALLNRRAEDSNADGYRRHNDRRQKNCDDTSA